MTQFIQHRVNTLDALAATPLEYGAEIDVRYHNNELVLTHDPFNHHIDADLTRLEDYAAAWRRAAPLILNIKTEGVEARCIEIMNRAGISNWFFLDLSMPYFVRYAAMAASGEIAGFTPQNLAVRFSEYEAIEYAEGFAGRAGWVWVDCFSKLPLENGSFERLARAGFRVCIVSPELQGHSLERINEFARLLGNVEVAAVCTKKPDLWIAAMEGK